MEFHDRAKVTTKTCCFFGHRKIFFTTHEKEGDFFDFLKAQIENLIVDSGYNEFLFGGYGDFDETAYRAVKSLKEKYPHIKTVYVQAYYKPHDKNIDLLREKYDELTFPEMQTNSKRYTIVYRNRHIINNSHFCIFYVKCDTGGACQALRYAKQKNKSYLLLPF